MYKKVAQTRLPKYIILSIAPLLGVITSCDQKGDPSYEKQSLILTAEKATAEANLKSTEEKLKTAEATIANLKGQIAAFKGPPPQPPQEVAAEPKFDKERIQLGFMRGVDDLKAKIEREKTQHIVESITFEKMNIPTDKPFSSGVTIKLKSKQTGQLTHFRWQGHGSIKGEWDFEPMGEVKSVSGSNVATNNQGDNPRTNTGTETNTETNTGTNQGVRVIREGTNNKGEDVRRIIWPEDNPRNTGQPTPPRRNPRAQPVTPQPQPTPQPPKQPVQPKRPTKPKQPTDPNSHKIDWDKLKK